MDPYNRNKAILKQDSKKNSRLIYIIDLSINTAFFLIASTFKPRVTRRELSWPGKNLFRPDVLFFFYKYVVISKNLGSTLQ